VGNLMRTAPAFASHDERIDWAGEQSWNVAEGLLDEEDAWFVYWMLKGWQDNPAWPLDVRKKYEQLAEVHYGILQLKYPRE
jgi:hypothetical protein